MRNQVCEVQLVAEFRDGVPVYEMVPAEKIAEGRYRLTASPGFAPGVASGDVIEVTPDERLGYRILERGGNVAVQIFLNSCSVDERLRIAQLFEPIHGSLDGGLDREAGSLLIFTVSVQEGFDRIERVLRDVEATFPVDSWMYGNVYDVKDGVTPLNWW